MSSASINYIPQVAMRGRVRMRAFIAWFVVAAVATGLVAIIVGAPLLLAKGYTLAGISIYTAFSHLCHQQSDRSFHLSGFQLAVCARCLGVYAGVAGALLVYPLIKSITRTDSPGRFWLFASAVPMVIDLALPRIGVWDNTHYTRLATGLLLGSVAAFYIVPGMVELAVAGIRKSFSFTNSVAVIPTDPPFESARQSSAPSDYGAPHVRI